MVRQVISSVNNISDLTLRVRVLDGQVRLLQGDVIGYQTELGYARKEIESQRQEIDRLQAELRLLNPPAQRFYSASKAAEESFGQEDRRDW